MTSFRVHPLSQFESAQTSIKRPKHILQFSLDETHTLHALSDQCLRYYYPPFFEAPWDDIDVQPGLVLSNGFDQFVKHDDSIDHHLDHLVRTIQAHEEAQLEKGVPIEDVRVAADVIAWRGILTKIMTAPYDRFADFELNATCFQDTIYLELNHSYMQTQDSRPQGKNPGRNSGAPPQELMQYWGYKFESLSTLPRPWGECSREEIEARDQDVVNNNVQYGSVTRTGIGSTSLIMGGEVDCVLDSMPDDSDIQPHWVELKTSVEGMRDVQKWEMKLLRFWAQSFLLGVPTIIIGFRTPNGKLTSLQTLETQKIPGQVKRNGNSWNGNVCISVTAGFLDLLKREVKSKDGVWRIKWNKQSKSIDLWQVEPSGTGNILDGVFKTHRDKLLALETAHRNG